jgi:hypothetical protein
MPRYLISFDDGSMDHIPEADQPAVGESAHVGVGRPRPLGSGSSVAGSYANNRALWRATGRSREEALVWAARIAQACRCAQEVREIGFDPES